MNAKRMLELMEHARMYRRVFHPGEGPVIILSFPDSVGNALVIAESDGAELTCAIDTLFETESEAKAFLDNATREN